MTIHPSYPAHARPAHVRGRAAASLALVVVVAVAVVLAIAVPAAPAYAAIPADTAVASSGSVVVAQDESTAPATVAATVIGIDAAPVAALTVTGHGGKLVTATAKGQPTRSTTASAGRPAVLRRLTPGVRYTIRVGGQVVGAGTPLGQVGPAAGLKVQTTDIRGVVALTWTHAPLRAEGSRVRYDVLATPLLADGTDDTSAILTATVTTTTARLDQLDPSRRYRFTITPRNTAGTGRSTTATMARTLNDATPTTTTPTPTATSTTAPVAPATQAPAPSGPSTKTIWVCPTNFTETAAGACQKTLAYTYTTTPYTYHQEATGPAPILDTYGTTGTCPADYNREDYGVMGTYCRKYGAVPTKTVKDDTPTGYTDTGTAWTIKDPAPAGYTDTGTQWVTTTAKVAKTVTS